MRRMMLLVSLTCLPLPISAAMLLGQTLQTTYLFPSVGSVAAGPISAVVGAGVELSNFAGFLDIDLSDATIRITANRDAGVVSGDVSFDGLHFFDVNGTIPAFTTVTLDPSTTYAGFTQSRISFDANNISVNLANQPGLKGQVIQLDLAPQGTVPEPATFLLAAIALGGIAIRRRNAV